MTDGKQDVMKLVFTYTVTILILAGGFYALVIYEYVLEELVKGAFLGFMGAAIAFVYGDQVASRTSNTQQKAFDAGVQTTPTVTTSAGPPATVTVTPPSNGDDLGAPPAEGG